MLTLFKQKFSLAFNEEEAPVGGAFSGHYEISRSPFDSSDSYLSSARAAMLSSPQHSPTH